MFESVAAAQTIGRHSFVGASQSVNAEIDKNAH